MRNLKLLTIIMLLLCNTLEAQHSIDVQKLTASADYYQALLTFDKMPKRQVTVEAVVAAAKSAWALGLAERATVLFEEALRSPELNNDSRARILLSRGVIEYQEERYQVAILYVEKVLERLKSSEPLRAKAWMLWGESLFQLGSYAQALEKYRKALNETSEDFVPEVNFLIGRCLVKLGRYADAQAYLEAVPVNNDRTPDAVRLLATSAIETGNFVDAEFWLKRGQEQYSEEFLDSWVDYALIKVAASKGDLAQMKEIQAKTLQKFPPSDHWVNLLNAAVEGYEWQIRAKVKEVQYE